MKGFKTVVLGVLIAATAILGNAEMQKFISENIPAVGAGIGAAIVILRAITDSGIFKK